MDIVPNCNSITSVIETFLCFSCETESNRSNWYINTTSCVFTGWGEWPYISNVLMSLPRLIFPHKLCISACNWNLFCQDHFAYFCLFLQLCPVISLRDSKLCFWCQLIIVWNKFCLDLLAQIWNKMVNANSTNHNTIKLPMTLSIRKFIDNWTTSSSISYEDYR